MKTIETIIRPTSKDESLVTVHMGDQDDLEASREKISLTFEVVTAGIPYLKEVQREALEKARDALDLEIAATKTVPRPSS